MTNTTLTNTDLTQLADLLRRLLASDAPSPASAPDRIHVLPPEEQLRDRLVEYVNEHPNCTAAEAGRALGVSKSVLHHHLNVCVGRGRLVKLERPVDGRRQVTMRTPAQDAAGATTRPAGGYPKP